MPGLRSSTVNGQVESRIFTPQFDDPKLDETIRQFAGYFEELRDSQIRMAGDRIPTDPDDLAALRRSLALGDQSASVAELTGLLGQPQRARVEIVDSLPDEAYAQEGELVLFQNILYVFVPASPGPGSWLLIGGTARIAQTITGNITIPNPNASGTIYPTGARLRYVFTYDATPFHVVSWATEFKGVSNRHVGRQANRVSIVEFDVLSPSVFVQMFSAADIDVS